MASTTSFPKQAEQCSKRVAEGGRDCLVGSNLWPSDKNLIITV
jgi:hypothetical protein